MPGDLILVEKLQENLITLAQSTVTTVGKGRSNVVDLHEKKEWGEVPAMCRTRNPRLW